MSLIDPILFFLLIRSFSNNVFLDLLLLFLFSIVFKEKPVIPLEPESMEAIASIFDSFVNLNT